MWVTQGEHPANVGEYPSTAFSCFSGVPFVPLISGEVGRLRATKFGASPHCPTCLSSFSCKGRKLNNTRARDMRAMLPAPLTRAGGTSRRDGGTTQQLKGPHLSRCIKTQRDKTGQWDSDNQGHAWGHAAFPINMPAIYS